MSGSSKRAEVLRNVAEFYVRQYERLCLALVASLFSPYPSRLSKAGLSFTLHTWGSSAEPWAVLAYELSSSFLALNVD